MYKKIIAGHDLHEGGRDAAALGRVIADATGAKLVVAGVFPIAVQPFAFGPEWREEEEQLVAAIQQRPTERRGAGGVPIEHPGPRTARPRRGDRRRPGDRWLVQAFEAGGDAGRQRGADPAAWFPMPGRRRTAGLSRRQEASAIVVWRGCQPGIGPRRARGGRAGQGHRSQAEAGRRGRAAADHLRQGRRSHAGRRGPDGCGSGDGDGELGARPGIGPGRRRVRCRRRPRRAGGGAGRGGG